MKDILQDIVSHTYNLGFLDIVKITGTKEKTSIDSVSDNRSVVLQAETTNPYPEMIGVFGMPQLNKLKYHLDCPEYKEDATIEIVKTTRNGEELLTGIHFENKEGDFQNDYKFMNTEIINEKLKVPKFRGVTWHVEVKPTLQSIQRFNFQSQANSEHTSFIVKTDEDKLIFTFGDQSTHGGEFIFATGIKGKLSRSWSWPVDSVLAILKIADTNNSTINFSNDGAMKIILDSGLAVYTYIIPANV